MLGTTDLYAPESLSKWYENSLVFSSCELKLSFYAVKVELSEGVRLNRSFQLNSCSYWNSNSSC